jgi:myo-inositol 2-dehydrogenase/D-chiro-inositol 1-dehydrogenase
MRRTTAYRVMRMVLEDGDRRADPAVPAHRNASSSKDSTSAMLITETAVYDIDIVPGCSARRSWRPGAGRNRRAALHLSDPLVVLLELLRGGVLADEANVNIGYGYDIRGEIVGDSAPSRWASGVVVLRTGGQHTARVPADWRERFARAYDLELQEDRSVPTGQATWPSAWDGYAIAEGDAAVRAPHTGERVAARWPRGPSSTRRG